MILHNSTNNSFIIDKRYIPHIIEIFEKLNSVKLLERDFYDFIASLAYIDLFNKLSVESEFKNGHVNASVINNIYRDTIIIAYTCNKNKYYCSDDYKDDYERYHVRFCSDDYEDDYEDDYKDDY